MRLLQSKMSKTFAVLAIGVLVLAGIAAANGAIPLPGSTKAENDKDASQASGQATAAVSLVQGKPHTLFVPEDVRTALGIRKDNVDLIAVAEKPTRTRPLMMPGTTALDPTRIFRIRALVRPFAFVGQGHRDRADRRGPRVNRRRKDRLSRAALGRQGGQRKLAGRVLQR